MRDISESHSFFLRRMTRLASLRPAPPPPKTSPNLKIHDPGLDESAIRDEILQRLNEDASSSEFPVSTTYKLTFTIDPADELNATAFLLNDATLPWPGDKINFANHVRYDFEVLEVGSAKDNVDFKLRGFNPDGGRSFEILATRNDLVLLLGRAQNCLHYIWNEEGAVSEAAGKAFEAMFANLPNFSTVRGFLENDRNGSFRFEP